MKYRIIAIIFTFIFFQGFVSSFLISDQGTNVKDIATGNLTALANITISIYDSSNGGNLIFEENFTEGIVNGSWNLMTNPSLEYGKSYWKDYKINDEDLDFDGNERLEIQSSVGRINNISFINFSLINSCPAGSSIRLIYENGSVECETDDSGSGAYNDSWINSTIDDKILIQNNSIINWANSIFVSISTLVNRVGNWSADKANYYNTTQVNDINASINNYINSQNTSQNNYINYANSTLMSILNNGSYFNSASTDTFISNYSTFLTHIDWSKINNGTIWSWAMNGTLLQASQWNATNTSYMVGDNFTIQNTSMRNYVLWVNSTNGAGSGAYNDAWINQTIYNKTIVDINLTNANTTLMQILNNGSYFNTPWNATNTSYMVGDNFTIQNTSMRNYVLWVNSTNGAGSGAYNDAWINQTIYNKTIVDINLTNANTTLMQILNNGSYFNTPWNATNTSYMVGDNFTIQNTSMRNYVLWVNSTNGAGSGAYNDAWINQTIYNKTIVDINLTNANTTLMQILNNGSYFNTPWNATNTSYMVGDNFTLQNTSMRNYVLWVNSTNGAGSGAYNDAWINQTIYNKTIVDINLTNANTTIMQILNNGSYFNTPWNATNTSYMVGDNFTLQNTSMRNYVLWVNSTNGAGSGAYNDAWINQTIYNKTIVDINLTNANTTIMQILNNGSYFNTPWNATNTSYMVGDNFTIQNTSMRNYVLWVNSTNGAGSGAYNDAWINQTIYNKTIVDINLTNANTTIMQILNNGSYFNTPWNATNTSYMVGDNFTLQNTSMRNYVLWVNSTNGAGSGAYNDAWINQTIYNKTIVDINLTNANTTLMQILNNGSYFNTPWNATNTSYMIGDNFTIQNTSMRNYVLWVNSTNGAGSGAYNDAWINQTIYNKTIVDINLTNANTTLMQILNNGSYFNTPWNATNTSYMIGDNFTIQNTSMRNYVLWVNSTNGAGSGAYNDAWINQTIYNKTIVDINLTNVNTTLYQILNNGSYFNTLWNATNTSYMVGDNFTIQNTSMRNYVLWVNSTNGAGSGAYNDAWINQTIYNKTIVDINLTNANTTLMQILNNGSYFNTPWNATNTSYMVGDNFTIQNTSMRNYVLWVNSTNGAGSGAYNDAWINQTIYNKTIVDINLTNANTTLMQILNNGSYFNTPWNATNTSYMVGDNFTLQNTSMRNYVLWVNSTNGAGIASESDPYWTGNYTIFNSTWSNTFNQTTNDSINNYILYVNSTNGAGSESLWNANYSTFLTHMPYSAWNATNTSYMLASNWNATNTSYMVGDNFTLQNTSMRNYVDWVNSTNGAGIASESDPYWTGNYSAYNASWSSITNLSYMTGDNFTLQNTSMRNYVDWVNSTNGAGIASESDPYWTGNYTTFNSSWSSITNLSYMTGDNFTLQNTSMRNYVDWVNSTNGAGIASESDPYWTGNYTTFNSSWSSITNTSYMTGENFSIQNTSMRNYVLWVNSTNGAGSESLWNANYSTFLTHIDWSKINNGTIWSWAMNGTLLQASQWNATNTSYMTGENFSIQNTSMRNYVLWVNSTNGAGIASESDPYWTGNYSAYNSSWSTTYNSTYNTWAYNQTIPANTYTNTIASTPDLHTHNASNITSPIWVNKTGDTMSGNLNMSSNNVTSVDCITFASGGKICSA